MVYMTSRPDSSVIERLHAYGLKSTAPRRVVLEVLDRGGHLDAAKVFERVKEELPGTSLQAVYGVLTALTSVKLARKIELSGGSALFESNRGDNHHHLLCSGCGQIEDIPCVVGSAPCLTPSKTMGFNISTADVTFMGLCRECQTTAS